MYDLAFGLSTEYAQEAQGNDEAVRLLRDGGLGNGKPPGAMSAANASQWARHYSMLANFIEATGPSLTAANMQARAVALGGTLSVSPRAGGGTSLVWTVPHQR